MSSNGLEVEHDSGGMDIGFRMPEPQLSANFETINAAKRDPNITCRG